MTPAIKICGICNLTDAELAIDYGAKYLGFIFAPSSPRYIEPAKAKPIVEAIAHKVKVVGVFQNAATAEIENIAESLGLDSIQLHGHETPATCASLSIPVIKSFQIAVNRQTVAEQPCLTLSFKNTDEQSDMDRCLKTLDEYRPYCSHFLFDKPKNVANAKWLDFAATQLSLIEEKLGNYFLAGGINSSNVKTVLQKLKPSVIDIASGVERTAREKNKQLMSEFFAALQISY